LLVLASEKAAVAAQIVPALAPRLTRLLEKLRRLTPASDDSVPAHGDFDAEQLVQTGAGEHVVLDFDDACLAPRALDLATYLADVVRGLPGDRSALDAVREPLLDGYGARPPHLEWYVAAVALTRILQPFQRVVPAWPERMRALASTVEEVLTA
jgi:N-acetylmuramate 1-kinase